MLIMLMSLAIALFSIQSVDSLPQHSNQTPQSRWVQQETKDATHPTILPILPPPIPMTPLALPPGDNAWTVQIVSRGGLTGSGRGDLTVTSEGILTWSGADGSCYRKLTDEAMQSLARIVLAADAPSASSEASFSGLCGDCFLTRMILQRRGAGGVGVFSAYWDDVSQAKVNAELMKVYEAVMAHGGCKL